MEDNISFPPPYMYKCMLRQLKWMPSWKKKVDSLWLVLNSCQGFKTRWICCQISFMLLIQTLFIDFGTGEKERTCGCKHCIKLLDCCVFCHGDLTLVTFSKQVTTESYFCVLQSLQDIRFATYKNQNNTNPPHPQNSTKEFGVFMSHPTLFHLSRSSESELLAQS